MAFESQFRQIINEPNYTNTSMRYALSVPINLQDALMCGSLDEIERILRETYGLTLLAQNDWELRCRQIVNACLEHEINVNTLDAKYSTLLHFVIKNLYEDFESVFFRCKDFNINALSTYKMSSFGISLLHLAIKNGQRNVAKVLLEFGADLEVQAYYLRTPLFYTIYYGEYELAEMLLKAGANVNAKDYFGITPINAAIRISSINNNYFNGNGKALCRSNILKLLCDYGAELHFGNEVGSVTLLYACKNGNFEELQFLMDRGANLLASDQEGYTAIHYAARGNHYDIIDFLLRSGVDVNVKNINRRETPIHELAKTMDGIYLPIASDCYGDPEFISTLWDLEYAAKVLKKSADMIEFLVDNGANVNTFNHENVTPLMESVQLNSLEIVECLLELKADVDKQGRSTYYRVDDILNLSYPEFRVNADIYADRVDAWQLLTAFLAIKKCDISAYCDANSTDFRWVHPFFEQCKTVVNQMKERTICENRIVTFFDFLNKDLMDVLQFCRNEEIMKVLESGKHKKEFRLYKYLFEKRMERVEKLQNCENAFRRLLDKYFKKKLPLVVVDEIISYLTAGNLRNFGRALRVSKVFPGGNFYYTK